MEGFDFSSVPSVEILQKAKIACNDIRLDQVLDKGFDLVQAKWDGWWAIAYLRQDGITVYSCGGVKIDFYLWESDNRIYDTVLIGEYIGRTNWSQTRPELGKLVVHDIFIDRGVGLSQRSYVVRYGMLETILNHLCHTKLVLCQATEITSQLQLNNLWQSLVVEDKFEGLVYKKSLAVNGTGHGRTKGQVSEDYVLMAINEGGGRLAGKAGALVGGLYVNGVLTPICSVGGGMSDARRQEFWDRRDELIGKVFVAYGACQFSSGSLRHPNLGVDVWREDKRPEDCILKAGAL